MNALPTTRRASLCCALLLFALGSGNAVAREPLDHDRARQALAAGEVLPLRTILERVEREHPGQVMEVELERRDEGWIYEIKLLRAGGELSKLKVDARDGRILDVRQRHEHREGKR